jgi:hypothetical protein
MLAPTPAACPSLERGDATMADLDTAIASCSPSRRSSACSRIPSRGPRATRASAPNIARRRDAARRSMVRLTAPACSDHAGAAPQMMLGRWPTTRRDAGAVVGAGHREMVNPHGLRKTWPTAISSAPAASISTMRTSAASTPPRARAPKRSRHPLRRRERQMMARPAATPPGLPGRRAARRCRARHRRQSSRCVARPPLTVSGCSNAAAVIATWYLGSEAATPSAA